MTKEDWLLSMDEVINLAYTTIEKNKDVFIAQYILQNPHVNLKDVVLCYKPDSDGNIQFFIKEKE